MAEIWGAAIAVGGSLISGYASQKEKEQDKKDAKVATRDEAMYSGILSTFERDLDNYYTQKQRSDKQTRGLSLFKKFSNVHNIAPNYENDVGDIVVPDKPDINKYLPAVQQKKKKKKKGLLGKITDPLGIMGDDAQDIADPLGIFGGF